MMEISPGKAHTFAFTFAIMSIMIIESLLYASLLSVLCPGQATVLVSEMPLVKSQKAK